MVYSHGNNKKCKFLNFLLSDEADKCNNREAAADQAFPPLRHWLQVRSTETNDTKN